MYQRANSFPKLYTYARAEEFIETVGTLVHWHTTGTLRYTADFGSPTLRILSDSSDPP